MERCPTCRARYSGGDVCHRCQTDLSQVLAVERAAVRFQEQTFAALRSGNVSAAYDHATQSYELHRSPDAIKALALASLASRKFDQAVALWREYRDSSSIEDEPR